MQVRKRDGRLEEFDRNKLKGGLVTAGASEEDAERYTTEVETWAGETAENDVIEATAIWQKVVEVLEASEPETAKTYKSFRIEQEEI